MELAYDSWAEYFQAISNEPRRLMVAMETVAGRAAADERIDAMCEGVCTRHPLRHISFEPSWDTLEVAVGLGEGGPLLRFFVAAPRSIFVKHTNGARAILVGDAGDGHTLLCLFTASPSGGRATTVARALDDEQEGPLWESRRRSLRMDTGRRGHRLARRGECPARVS